MGHVDEYIAGKLVGMWRQAYEELHQQYNDYFAAVYPHYERRPQVPVEPTQQEAAHEQAD